MFKCDVKRKTRDKRVISKHVFTGASIWIWCTTQQDYTFGLKAAFLCGQGVVYEPDVSYNIEFSNDETFIFGLAYEDYRYESLRQTWKAESCLSLKRNAETTIENKIFVRAVKKAQNKRQWTHHNPRFPEVLED